MHNLYEPRKYSRALEEMYNTTILDPTLGNTTYACLQPTEWRDSHTGLGRYAGERWAYSVSVDQNCARMTTLPDQFSLFHRLPAPGREAMLEFGRDNSVKSRIGLCTAPEERTQPTSQVWPVSEPSIS
eukprot:scaffold307_cov162-Amphora_coffeaeformis.AAC.2